MSRSCACGAPITRHSKTGRCRPCVMAFMQTDPAVAAKRVANLRKTKATPAHRKIAKEARLKLEAERANDPAWQEMKRQFGFTGRARFEASPGAEGRRVAALSISNKQRSERAMAWCPEDRRSEYLKLRRQVGAPEARRILEADFAAVEARRVAALTPLQRQLERLQNGATLVEKPVFRRAEHDFSLTGNATAML